MKHLSVLFFVKEIKRVFDITQMKYKPKNIVDQDREIIASLYFENAFFTIIKGLCISENSKCLQKK